MLTHFYSKLTIAKRASKAFEHFEELPISHLPLVFLFQPRHNSVGIEGDSAVPIALPPEGRRTDLATT